jgi:K+ transporter
MHSRAMLLITRIVGSRRRLHRRWTINIAVLVSVTLLFVIGYFSASASRAMQVGFRVFFLALILYAVAVVGYRWSKTGKLPSFMSQTSIMPRSLRRFLLDEEDDDQPKTATESALGWSKKRRP